MKSLFINRRGALGALSMLPLGLLGNTKTAEAATASLVKQSVTRGNFRKYKLEEFAPFIKELGLHGMDFVSRDDWEYIQSMGLVATMVSGGGRLTDGTNDKGNHEEMLRQFRENIPAAAQYGWPNVITFSGNRRGMSDEEGLENSTILLKEAVKVAEDHGVTICMELLNSKVDHPDYMCDHTSWGVELCKRVGSPRFKLLYDIYHMQIMEGDIIRTIRDNIDYIAHFHTAGNPGRRDLDDHQEMNYVGIARAVADLTAQGKYDGYFAHEFSPKNGLQSLKEAYEICNV